MRTRSYEFYEVVTDITGRNRNVHFRGGLESARKHFDRMAEYVEDRGNVYLIRCQVIEAMKRDKS